MQIALSGSMAILAFLYYALLAVLYSPRSSLLIFWPLLGVFLFFLAFAHGFLFWLLFLPALLFCLLFFSFCLCAARGVKTPQTPPQALILLGLRGDGTLPESMEEGRIALALSLLKRYPDIPCILTGGRVFREKDAESRVLYRKLCRCGVDPDRLILEGESRTTKENFLFSFPLLPQGIRSCAVVTSRYHLFRASLTALSSDPPCPLSFHGAASPLFFLPHLFVREFFTFSVDVLKGNIRFPHFKS